MGGCGTSLKGRAIFEVYENGVQVHEYDWWVRNYISAKQGLVEGRYKPEEVGWFGAIIYLKEADSTTLTHVWLMEEPEEGGTGYKVSWLEWSEYDDAEVSYAVEGKSLGFTFDPYEGLVRYTLTIVPRESIDDPVPESWNGVFFFDEGCPLRAFDAPSGTWKWVDSHTIDVGVSGDLLVTPYGEDPGVVNPIATREIAVRRA